MGHKSHQEGRQVFLNIVFWVGSEVKKTGNTIFVVDSSSLAWKIFVEF